MLLSHNMEQAQFTNVNYVHKGLISIGAHVFDLHIPFVQLFYKELEKSNF